jgi:TetR/AcrR family transcriptional regulator, ethionamide resistance regulator
MAYVSPRARRSRRAARPSADDRERAILETAERLLEERSLHDISIEDLARGAGLSRSAFYFYFPDKEAVLLTLLDGVAAEADAARQAALAQVDLSSPADVCRASIGAFYSTFRARRAIALAAAEARPNTPEVGELWGSVMEAWVASTARIIAGERAAGAAPDGVPAGDLSIALNLMNERVLHATFANDTPSIDEARVVDALVAVWLGAIYGGGTP